MLKILLIEPNKLLASQYSSSLISAGYEVLWCQDAQESITVADKHHPDIVITELALSSHSGIEFLYEFRSYSEWQNIPVIILSRLSQDNSGIDSKTLQKLGVKAFLYKPDTNLKSLINKVKIISSELKAV
jgi:DNA-binding response OmpR family regulator